MKKLLLTFVLLVGIVFGLFAQKLTYQAVIRDNNQQLVTNTAVKATATITFSTGNPYSEVVNGSTNIHGLLSFEFGDGTLNGRDWTRATIAVKVVKADDESTVYVNDDARSVSAVPYALSVNGQSIQQYLNEHNYVTQTQVADQIHDSIANIGTFTEQQVLSISTDTIYLTGGSFVKLPAGFSGNYNDLTNTPAIPTVPTNVSAFTNDAGYITNAAVPTNVSELTNDANYITAADVPAQVNADWNATEGAAEILNKPELFSGDYNDLSNKPTIPAAANNATLTIQKNGTSVGTFTADASSDKSINITVPTTTSELTNNSGFITTANVPTNVSQLNNDAGYLTNADVTTLLSAVYDKIDSLAHLVDSLSNLPHGGGGTPTVADGQPCPGTATVSDVDGNTYNTVKIGNQCWMKENLRTTTKRNNVGNVYTENTTAGYNAETYGYYYDWEAVMQNESGDKVQGICPTGWHVPTWAEYLQLTDYVNSQPIFCCYGESGKISKALASSEGWASVDRPDSECCIGNAPARNNWTRFSLMPAGYYLSGYRESGMEATIWSATDFGSMVHVLWLDAASDEIGETLCLREMGCSVRCLRDASIGGGDNPSEPATMSCEQVMQCIGDTLGRLNAKIEAQGAEIETLNGTVTTQGNTIDSLAHLVDSLSNLTPGGEPTATFTCGTSTVTDYDGNTYNTVQIGQQCWMKQNLKTTHYSDGTSISLGSSTSTTTAYRYNPDDNSSNVATYGYLYNWKAVMRNTSSSSSNPSGVQGICPTGWHVPSDAEWTQLKNYVSSQSQYVCGSNNTYIAKALASTTGWITSSTTCAVGNTPSNNNATGFSAVPAGIYDGYDGSYDNFGNDAYFWSATQGSSYSAYGRYLGYNLANVRSNSGYDKNNGYSVRCLRDASIGGGDNPSAPAMMSCEQVMQCMGDTLGQLNAKIEAQGNTIDSLANSVDSLSRLIPDTPGIPTDTFICGTSTVTDHEGNVYNTVQVGDQCWTKENMRCTTSPSTGTSILEYPASSYTYSGKKAYYPNDNASNVATYGLLYNWCAAVDTFNTAYGETSTNTSYDNAVSVTFSGNRRGICPQGWHVPSDAEWTQLENYVGSQSAYQCGGNSTNIAKALASTTGWSSNSNDYVPGNDPSTNNATGFSAVPAGYYYGSFDYFGNNESFWSATQYNSSSAYYRYLDYNSTYVNRYRYTKYYGFSVRCLRDASIGGGDNPSAPAMMSCEQVMQCMGDTLGRLNAKIEAQGNTIDSLANSVDSLSRLIHDTPGIPTDTFICGTSTVTDHEGNVYNTVQVGDQCWTKENMRCTTSPSTGTNILEFPASSYTYSGKKAYYPNDNASNVATYGLLYNWCAAVDTFNTAYGETSTNTSYDNAVSVTFSGNRRGICPQGWHVPSDAEWTQLTTYVGSQSEYVCYSDNTNIAKALASTTGWSSNSNDYDVPGNDPSTNNATGFSAVPAGGYGGSYGRFGNDAYFWSATQNSSSVAYYRYLDYGYADVSRDGSNKYYGFSVRCLRDGGVGGAPATNESGSAGNAGGSSDSGCCTELGARMDSLQNVIDGLQNTVSSQDSVINALNNELHPFVCGTSTVTDHEGNVYNTVQVGDQCWTKENMRCTTSPSTGTNILEFPASSYTYSGKKAYYPNDNASNVATYGLLYNWNAAVDTFNTAYGETSTNTSLSNAVSVTFSGNRRGICPQGWHVPSDAEWTQLENYVGSQSAYQCGGNSTNIAKALASTTGWDSSTNTCAVGNTPSTNNATGFSAVPAGLYYGSYYYFGLDAWFWSATQNNSYYAYFRDLYYNNASVDSTSASKYYGYSVRCLRD